MKKEYKKSRTKTTVLLFLSHSIAIITGYVYCNWIWAGILNHVKESQWLIAFICMIIFLTGTNLCILDDYFNIVKTKENTEETKK